MKYFSKRNVIIGGIVIAIALIGWGVYARSGAAPVFETAEVKREAVRQDVIITGRVEPVVTYDLSFAASGVIKTLAVAEGDTVAAGQTLATLEVSDVAMQRAQTNAALVGDRQTAELAVQEAKLSLTQTERVNDVKLEEAKQRVRNAKVKLDIADEQFDRIKAEDTDEASAAYLSAESSYTTALANYQELQQAVRVLEASNAQLEKSGQAEVAGAEQALRLKQDTIAADGTLSANRAALGYQSAVLGKSVLRAPAAGLISNIALQVGEFASPSTPVISLVTPELHMTANVPEADIAKLAVGASATVTLDAYGQDIEFAGMVASINQTETLVDGVATYQATFAFTQPDVRIKSGMTANITVHADKREGVLAIPQRAVINRNGDKVVRLADGESFREVPITTGLRGSDGTIEVASGLQEGDRVVIFVEGDK
jgi:HlyD family secretion protein